MWYRELLSNFQRASHGRSVRSLAGRQGAWFPLKRRLVRAYHFCLLGVLHLMAHRKSCL